MARPKKQTVEYFPHQCIHGKTLYIIEQRYGNDGYAFWFKLLELLGSTAGHALDLNQRDMWEFLTAKTRIDDGLCIQILDSLARLDAIDAELWKQKIVWSDNFTRNIADAYRRRLDEMPIKPSLCIQKPTCNVVSDDINAQSKVKESKVNKSKVKKSICDSASVAAILSSLNPELSKTVASFVQYREKKGSITERAVELLVSKVCEMSPDNQTRIDILNQSIMNGWSGLFELKAKQPNKTAPKYKPNNVGNFEQREYTDDFLNEFIEKVVIE